MASDGGPLETEWGYDQLSTTFYTYDIVQVSYTTIRLYKNI